MTEIGTQRVNRPPQVPKIEVHKRITGKIHNSMHN